MTLNSEEIKPVALTIIEVRFSEHISHISQSIGQSVGRSVLLNNISYQGIYGWAEDIFGPGYA